VRIALIGQRGVPATFGGIEHHVEELGARLADRGHDVVVFCRPNYGPSPSLRSYRGMRLRYVPTVGTKHLEAIVHSGLSTLATIGHGFDVIHYHALGPGIMTPIARAATRARVVQTIHGLDYLRNKWGWPARTTLRFGAWLSAHVPHATIVVSEELYAHYRDRYGRKATHITNGVEAPQQVAGDDAINARWGLTSRGYLLFVGRLVPEKSPDALIRAFARIPGPMRLVLVGGSSFTDGYTGTVERLAAADNRVLMAGPVYGQALDELYAHAAAFVLPSTVEGLPLVLLEAAAHATPVVASAIPPHLEVLKADEPGRRLHVPGDEDSLIAAIGRSLSDPAGEHEGAAALRSEVLATYRWDDVVEATEALYRRLVEK